MNSDVSLARVHKALANFLERASSPPAWIGQKVVIYGAGNFGRDVAKLLKSQNVNVLGFLDQKGSGQTVIEGLRAYPLLSPQAKGWLAEDAIALIGTHNRDVSLQEILGLLKGFGFKKVFTPMEIYLQLGRELGWRFWLGTKEQYADAASRVEQAYELWADEQSKRLFLETLLFRLEFDVASALPTADVSFQYSDLDVPRWKEPLRIVDGGAYTGDTLESLLHHRYRIQEVHAFEPDLENFRKLRKTVATRLPHSVSSLWPCGMWSETTRLTFSDGGGSSSKLSEVGAVQVPVIALDEVLHGHSVNLIKLDIEGAEADALQGARRIIQKYRPGLAICLYHHPHHLWSIPLWVSDLHLNYKMYYRTYAQSTFESVLYAIGQ